MTPRPAVPERGIGMGSWRSCCRRSARALYPARAENRKIFLGPKRPEGLGSSGARFGEPRAKSSARIELDDQVRLHMRRIRDLGEPGNAREFGRTLGVIDFEIVGHVPLGQRVSLKHQVYLARGFLDLDQVADLHLKGGDVDAPAVDLDVAVVDELARGKHGRHELGAVDEGVEPALEQADEVGARVALEAQRLDIIFVELALRNVAVVALDLLLGLELGAEVGRLALAALAMLARPIFTLVEGAAGAPPDVFAHPAIDLVFCFRALRHRNSSRFSFNEERALLCAQRKSADRPLA